MFLYLTRLCIVFAAVMLIGFTVAPAAAQAAVQSEDAVPYASQSDPIALLTSYYNAINLQDYARAYAYWRNPPYEQTFEQFAAGFASTEHVEVVARLPVIVGATAGSLYASIPVMLFVEASDNATPPHYIACFTAWKSNVASGNANQPDPNWYLHSAEVYSVAITNLELVDNVCAPGAGFAPSQLSPEFALVSYYAMIQGGEYARAYAYWETPPNGQSLEDFASGFANVAAVKLYVRLAGLVEGAAGSSYATVPALLNVTRISGDPQWFTGCFVLRRANVPVGDATAPDPNWYLYDAELEEMFAADFALRTLLTACALE